MNKQMLKTTIADCFSKYSHWRMVKSETKKFRDPRRVKIANEYPLTKEQKEQIDELYLKCYGKKIDYVWHQNYAAHAGHFDPCFFPEHLYIPEFEFYQNQNKAAIELISDKNFLPLVAKAVGVKMPKTIISCTNGVLRNGENFIISEDEANHLLLQQKYGFIKPSVDSCSGNGCCKKNEEDSWHINNNILFVKRKDAHGGGYKSNYVVQELVKCHKSISDIYPDSVNTFRVITYLWKNKIEIMPIIIRIGQGGKYLDNAHAGGMFCAVYNDGRMGDHAVTEFNNQFYQHPDTHIVFAKHSIQHVDKVIDAAKRMHSAIPQIGVVNWDFTVNEEGEAVLIEANVKSGSIWLPQMAHGIGAFGSKTPEVLKWLRFMKKLEQHERAKFTHGRMGQ